MPDLSGLFGNRDFRPPDAVIRAAAAWRRIQDRPSSVVVYRGATPLAAQTVRIEFDNEKANMQTAEAGKTALKRAVLFGVNNHPTEDDTDLQKDDRITLDDGDYQVIAVINPPGEVQATVERIS